MNKGFSLIELLIIIALIVLVAAVALPRLGNAKVVEQTGFVQNVREFVTLAPSEARSRSADVQLSRQATGVALITGGSVISDKTLTVPSGVTFASTFTAHPDGSSDGSVKVTTRDGCTSFTLSFYGDLQEATC